MIDNEKVLKKIVQNNKAPIAISILTYISGLLIGILFIYFIDINLGTKEIPFLNENVYPFQERPTTLTILQNNIQIILILISGSFLLGLTTLISLLINGFIFGMATTKIIFGGVPALLSVIPHAIFEIPSMFLAGAAGLKIPYELVRYFTGKKDYILNKEEVMDFLTLIGIAILLIIIAAIIEANVTLKIAEML
jgi:uncharacterized membrane protein SpoIIM required for sporulation